MASLIKAMREANEIHEPSAYIAYVKKAFESKVLELDPVCSLTNTGYFNHSATPDFFLRWDGESVERPVFLRRSFEEIVAWRDVRQLGDAQAVVVSLNESQGGSLYESSIQSALAERPQTKVLVTAGLALDHLSPGRDSKPQTLSADAAFSAESPLHGLLAANLLRGGRGLIDAERADELAASIVTEPHSISSNFLEDSVRNMAETIDLVRATLLTGAELPAGGGLFSSAEAARLLPWILKNAERDDEEYWRALGKRLTLETLEEVAESIEGANLSRLVKASWKNWSAARGYLGLNVGEDSPGVWTMQGGLLTFLKGNRALRLTTDGRRLKGRPSSSSALWEDIRGAVPPEGNVVAVTFRGVDRSVSLSSDGSARLTEDIERILGTFDSHLFVELLRIDIGALEGEGEDALVEVSFSSQLATATTRTSLRSLAMCVAQLVNYQQPMPLE